ncbi:MAG: TetR family transcriptional regulator [Pseudonocardiales bacterium]|nr:MAG: TetR family transcriptional regulator [Pseudonocardiales bacterium]
MSDAKVDGRLERGEHTRRLILERAVDIASTNGLEGLSIGRLSSELAVSKSGVFAHFGSKEELQLATLALARDVFIEHVITPALRAPAGLPRLWVLCEARLDYMSERVFPGGCFFAAAATEFDSRPGRVRDAIVASERDVLRFYETIITVAIEQGELAGGTDSALLAFELDALSRTAGTSSMLFDDSASFTMARKAILGRLRSAATDPSVLPKVPN